MAELNPRLIVLHARETPTAKQNVHVILHREKSPGVDPVEGTSLPSWKHYVISGDIPESHLQDQDTALVARNFTLAEAKYLSKKILRERGAPQPIETAVRKYIQSLDRKPAPKDPEARRAQRNREDFLSE